MKVVILAGRMGIRISRNESDVPKPLIGIGGFPIIWHIMKTYSYYGFNEFVICCGYKGYLIKEYFLNYVLNNSDITIDMHDNSVKVNRMNSEPWKISLVDTGMNTPTAERLLQVREYIGDETFMVTYADGLADININALMNFHKNNSAFATITVAKPTGRWGMVQFDEETHKVYSFREKKKEDVSWANAGYAVFEPEVFGYLEIGEMLEGVPYQKLTEQEKLIAYRHHGFWAPMDTMVDRKYIEECWNSGRVPWKMW